MNTENLLKQILHPNNLNQAYLQVKRNKGAAGVDGMTINELGHYLKENGEEIKDQIRTRSYQPKPVKRIEIPKADGGVRNLGVPTVVDRFIQQAMAQVLTPIYEEKFHENSYGFRPGRCAEMAIIKSLEFMNDGYTWIVDIDLEKFFDKVNHDKLMRLISNTIKDGDVISLIRKFLVRTARTPHGRNRHHRREPEVIVVTILFYRANRCMVVSPVEDFRRVLDLPTPSVPGEPRPRNNALQRLWNRIRGRRSTSSYIPRQRVFPGCPEDYH